MATKKLVPRADGEGGIGTALKKWASGFFDALTVGGAAVVTTTASQSLSNKSLVAPALGAATATSLSIGGGTVIAKRQILTVAVAADVSGGATNTQSVAVTGLVRGDGLSVAINGDFAVIPAINYLSPGNANVHLTNTNPDDEQALNGESINLIIVHDKK